MATIGLLPQSMLLRLHDAFLAASLDLDSLLSVLPADVRQSVHAAPAPQGRLVVALHHLNGYRTSEDNPPLRSFLEWAAKMCGPRVEASVLREAVVMLDEGVTLEHGPGITGHRRPWYLSMAKRLYRQQGFCDIESPESTSPVFVGWADMRARVVGVTVGDLPRMIGAVEEHVRFVRRGAFSVEGHVLFPESGPSESEEKAVTDAGLVPMRLDDVRRRAERYVRSRVAPPIEGVIARQTAWAVERCKTMGEWEALEVLRDRTACGLADLVREVGGDAPCHVLIHTSTVGLRAVAGASLLTAWNEAHSGHGGRWPLYLPVERPLSLDLDELLDGVLAKQRVTSERTVADSLFSDDESVPVLCCGAGVTLSNVRHLIEPILARKGRGVVLASDGESPAPLWSLAPGAVRAKAFCFPADFELHQGAAA